MKPITWSYSSLDLFKQCPHKYYRMRVKKDIVEPKTPHLDYGLDFHKCAEDFIGLGTPLPERFSFARAPLEVLKNKAGQHLCEYQLGLTSGLAPCGFKDKDVWWRGIADLLIINGDKAIVIDYKTGKSAKYADTKQLEILSLAVFKHFPQIKKIKSGLLFVVSNEFVRADFAFEDQSIKCSSRKWLG